MSNEIIKKLDEMVEGGKQRAEAINQRINEIEGNVNNLLKKGGRIGTGTKSDSIETLGMSVEQALNESGTTERLKSFISGSKKSFSLELKDMSIADSYTGGTALVNTSPYGVVGSVSRFSHVRDIIPKIQMENGTIPIINDNGVTGSFTTVAEGGTKPTIDFELAESPAKAEVIAAICNVTRQFMDDLGPRGVAQWMQSRLTELYLQAEDDQIMNGDGVSPNLDGLNTAGNFTAATSLAADNNIIQLVTSITQMRTLGRRASAIIIHPGSLASLLLNQSTGSGEFDLPSYVSVNAAGGISILGVPVIDTPGQTAGTFSVLDTSQMVMGIRENFNIRMFEEDGDNVRKNRITVRAEARIAFANFGAINHIKGTF